MLAISGSAGIIIDREILNKYSLRAGLEIDSDRLEKIRLESDRKRAEDYITYLLSKRGYSNGLLRAKMEIKGFEPGVINSTLAQFRKRGLIDDAEFARQTVEAILRRKPAGRGFLTAYLQARHISRQLASTVVDKCLSNIDEIEIAVSLLKGRRRYLAKFELETARRKAYNYLSRRSISYRAAKEAFERMLKATACNGGDDRKEN